MSRGKPIRHDKRRYKRRNRVADHVRAPDRTGAGSPPATTDAEGLPLSRCPRRAKAAFARAVRDDKSQGFFQLLRQGCTCPPPPAAILDRNREGCCRPLRIRPITGCAAKRLAQEMLGPGQGFRLGIVDQLADGVGEWLLAQQSAGQRWAACPTRPGPRHAPFGSFPAGRSGRISRHGVTCRESRLRSRPLQDG